MLCAYCQAFDFRSMAAEVIANCRDPLRRDDNFSATHGSDLFKYHSTILGVQCAITDGCSLCSLLLETWLNNSQNWEWGDVEDFLFSDEEIDQKQPTEKYKAAILHSPESFTLSLSLSVCKVWKDIYDSLETDDRLFRLAVACVCFEVEGGNPEFLDQFSSRIVKLGIYAKAEDEAVVQGLLELRERSSTPDFDLAKKWLQRCLNNHPCGPRNAIPRLPTRVIDIGQSVSDLRLFESGGRHAKYTALSHCWGTSPIWTTTVKNQKLPHYSELPGNFQDAITVTRMLGLQYLWIDSLCILQDSAEDWEIECSNMANIYKNAEVTVSIRDNTSSSPGGFLQELRSPLYKSYELNDGLTISSQPVDWSKMRVPVPLGGVDKRGWILQERILSRRLLHFNKQRMYWECCRHTCFEGLHHPVVAPFGRQENFFAKKLALERLKQRTTRDVYSYWYEVVHDYSERQSTKQIDKLPALSGLAWVFADVLRDTYLAGLWKNDFVWGLCWRAMKSRHVRIESAHTFDEPCKQVTEWVAPSWSWASCNRCVEWLVLDPSTNTFHERLKVQSVKVHSKGHDPYGVIGAASLTVLGKMKCALIDGGSCFDAASGESLGNVFFDMLRFICQMPF